MLRLRLQLLLLLLLLTLGVVRPGMLPRSLPALQRDAVARAGLSAAVLAGFVSGGRPSLAAAAAGGNNGLCTCSAGGVLTGRRGSSPCRCSPPQSVGQEAVAEQIDSVSKGYFYNPRNERIYDCKKKSFIPAHPEAYLSKELLSGRQAVVVGEIHSNRCHHHAEFEILRSLSEFQPSGKLAIGLECFYRQHQNALDDFVFSHQNMGKLKQAVNWKSTWGYDLNYYAKIFQFCALNRIRLVGLNVPYQVVQLVGLEGYDGLPSQLKSLMPALDLDNKQHRQQFIEAITGAGSTDEHNTKSDSLQRMYEAQTLWDEYMAESSAFYIKSNPSHLLLVIAGVGHVLGRSGIPDRIQKRSHSKNPPFVILPQQVGWQEASGLPDITVPLTIAECDWAWYTEGALPRA